MLSWNFLTLAFPTLTWGEIGISLTDGQIFGIETFYTKPGAAILIRQAFGNPSFYTSPLYLYPDHNRYLIKLPIPSEFQTSSDADRRIQYKLSEIATFYEPRIALSFTKLSDN